MKILKYEETFLDFPYWYDISGLATLTGLDTRDSFGSRGFGLSALRLTILPVILRGLPRWLFIWIKYYYVVGG